MRHTLFVTAAFQRMLLDVEQLLSMCVHTPSLTLLLLHPAAKIISAQQFCQKYFPLILPGEAPRSGVTALTPEKSFQQRLLIPCETQLN